MKKIIHFIAFALLLSCTKELEQPVQPEKEPGTYTLIVQAGKGERPDTKALGFDEAKLTAFWAVGEEVSVYKGETLLGTLSAQSEGKSTTLEGQISGEIKKDDVLTLKFLSPSYSSQDGTLEYIAAHCDFALASVTVQSIEGSTVTTDKAVFENQQAIVEFDLNVSAKPLIVTINSSLTITVTPQNPAQTLMVAIPALSGADVFLKATAEEKVYMLDKSGVTLEAGKYYAINATLPEATVVHNDAELRSAIETNGAKILVANDIDLSNSTLSIAEGTTVTIDLNGHTLDRKLTKRGEGGGQVITVRSTARLNIKNGTLQGGWGGDSGGINNEGGTANLMNVTITGCTGDDRGGGICNRSGGTLTMTGGRITWNTSNDHGNPSGGGGIFNAEGATASLKNVTIIGNEAKSTGGGGICNLGTLTIDGCAIENNICKTEGCGIWSGGTATLNMQGEVIVYDNVKESGLSSNLYLRNDAVVNITGALTGSNIGVGMETPGTFTKGYSTYHSGELLANFFDVDQRNITSMALVDDEGQLSSAIPEGGTYYVERSWNERTQSVEADFRILESYQYTTLTGSDDDVTLSLGYYVVKGSDVVYDDRIIFSGGGNHYLILCDGAKISAEFFTVNKDNTLYIYGQSGNTGKMINTYGATLMDKIPAGIGGAGAVIIHGGTIDVHGGRGGAGIGGNDGHDCNSVTIYGGTVSAVGGHDDDGFGGAGIGGGGLGSAGVITIYGGTVTAQSSTNGTYFHKPSGAGIGCGALGNGGTITIYGGHIDASSPTGAGIGSGYNGNGANVTIHGGYVKAWVENAEGAGIGTGYDDGDITSAGTLTVTGGRVYAYGAARGAGIGGGWDASGANVTISGGYVYAEGGKYAAGIGSGCEGLTSGGRQGGSLTVTGGRVEAYGGEDGAGIGGGEDADGGTVNISGGYVYAKGSYGGAGIGGGEEGDGAKVTITGGTVHASAGSGETGNRAIGPGYGSDEYGSLTLGGLLMVWSERMAEADERVPMCWYRTDVHVEPCTHAGYTAETCPYHKHD